MPRVYQDIKTRAMMEGWVPDLSIGSSSFGIGWAGLYTSLMPGGIILYENATGNVTMITCQTNEKLDHEWNKLAADLELSGDPEEWDYVIEYEDEYRAFRLIPGMDLHSTIEEAKQHALANMLEEQEMKRIWFLNANKNFILIGP